MQLRRLLVLSTLLVLSSATTKIYAQTPFDGSANFAITPKVATPSLIAALVMGSQGYQNYIPPLDWPTLFNTQCKDETTRLSWAGPPGTTPTQDPARAWPDFCDPWGAVSVIKTHTRLNWTLQIYEEGQFALLLGKMIQAIALWHSPVIIPIYGQADHWAVFFKVTGFTSLTTGAKVISKIWFEDGLQGGVDSGGNSNLYSTYGKNVMTGSNLTAMAYQWLAAINPDCVPCFTDPLYGKFVVLFAPPSGLPLRSEPSAANVEYISSPSLIKKGSRQMTAQLAKERFAEALQLANVSDDEMVAGMLAAGKPTSSVLVNGVWAAGQPWNYYLITLADEQGRVVGYVQLSADDGAFERVFVPHQAHRDIAVTADAAAAIAGSSLERGQRLGTPQLRWDPRMNHIAVRSPHGPFYEFPVLTSQGSSTGQVIQVSRQGGMLLGQAKTTSLSVGTKR